MARTRFWLLRHAIVDEASRAFLYGRMDVPCCPIFLQRQAPSYKALAQRLPRDAAWVVSPLSRTHRTAAAIQQAGYPAIDRKVNRTALSQGPGCGQDKRYPYGIVKIGRGKPGPGYKIEDPEKDMPAKTEQETGHDAN